VADRSVLRLAAIVALAVLPAAAGAQLHPAEHAPLTHDGPYPRSNTAALMARGFPDHMHEWHYSTWRTPVDAAGDTYGPGAFCHARELIPREGLEYGGDTVRWRRLVLRHNPGYEPCDMLPFVEIMDLARRRTEDLLELVVPDTLVMINPDNNDQYKAQTGQGVWRLYQLRDDVAVLQPIGILQARTLDGHAGHMLAVDWTLRHALPVALPLWLHHGLVEYMGENGVHLVNYMAEFRDDGPVLWAPQVTEETLAAGVNPDPGVDREMYRRASYNAFLMVWELVENQGGLAAMREFLHLVRDGEDPDAASVRVWGLDLAGLADLIDPEALGEPLGEATQVRRPHIEP
jgi:hypothetical protein